MDTKSFFDKLKSRFLWLNLAAMAAVVLALVIGVGVALNYYTHHGENIDVPDVHNLSMDEAVRALEEAGLVGEVADTGYVKGMPAFSILEQMPAAGSKVKSGHIIRLIVNSSSTPSLALPDLADNCSLREAVARLKAMGFKLGTTQYVEGEKDWVYGVLVNGRRIQAGDRVAIDKTIVLQVGSGASEFDGFDSDLDFGDDDFETENVGDIDDFEEVF